MTKAQLLTELESIISNWETIQYVFQSDQKSKPISQVYEFCISDIKKLIDTAKTEEK